MKQYRCKSQFVSSTGVEYTIGQRISGAEFINLSHQDSLNFEEL